jgi:sec-independent protein translocase protein TatB
MFELSIEKLVVIGLIAAFLIGPERLPVYATKLARLVRVVRGMADDAKGRLQDELGPDFDADWQRLDPRRYDPRRIVRDALTEDEPLSTELRPAPQRARAERAVVDDEAT